MGRAVLLILTLFSSTVLPLWDPLIDLIEGNSVEIDLGASSLKFTYKGSLYVKTLPVDPIVHLTDCDPSFLKAVMRAESDFRIHARSWANAMGVAQFIPLTGDWMGLRNPFDPIASTFTLCRYLKYLSRKFKSREEILWAYHDGETRVRRSGPTPTGRRYAERVLKYYEEYERSEKIEWFVDRLVYYASVGYSFDGGWSTRIGLEGSVLGVVDLSLGFGYPMGLLGAAFVRVTHSFAVGIGYEGTPSLKTSYRVGLFSYEFSLSGVPALRVVYNGWIGLVLERGIGVYLRVRE